MQVIIKSVGPVETKQGPKASYQIFELGYESNGKAMTKKIMEFNREVFGIFKSAAVGSAWDVKVEKDKTGKYWNWIGAVPSTGTGGGEVRSFTRGSGETPEERAARQVYIVRQSSIASAVALLAAAGTKGLSAEGVIEIAKKFEKFVFGGVETEEEVDTGEPV